MAEVTPRRGGNHPTNGNFIGGSPLDNQYRLVGKRHYKYTAQRRSAKVVNSIEQALLTTIKSKQTPTFNVKLEKTHKAMNYNLKVIYHVVIMMSIQFPLSIMPFYYCREFLMHCIVH